MPYWRTCVFQGIGSKRESFLDLLDREMGRKGFKLGGDYKTPDGKSNIIIQAVPYNGDLKVGFMFFSEATALFFGFVALGFILAVVLISIIRYFVPSIDKGPLIILTCITFFGIPVVGISILNLPVITWNRELIQILVETAESMGSKPLTPFKREAKM